MTSRRGQGEGAIFQRPDGKWSAVLDLGRHPTTGRRMRRKVTTATRADAHRALKQLDREAAEGRDRTSKRTTVAQWCEAWLSTVEHRVAVGDLKPRTAKAYDVALRVHIVPALGRVRLDDLDRPRVERFYRALRDGGMAASTAGRVAVVLRLVVGFAVDEGAVAGNVVTRVKPPKVVRAKAPALAGPELARLLAASDGDARRLFELQSLTGLRIGEAVALRWGDVSTAGPVPALRVERTAGQRTGESGTPKSTAGRRTVPLVPRAVEVLRAQRTAQRAARLAHPGWREQDAVFSTDGGALALATVDGWFRAARGRAGLPAELTSHALRHGWVRRLLTEGVPAVVVASAAGHTVATLHSAYADVLETDDGSAVAAMLARALA